MMLVQYPRERSDAEFTKSILALERTAWPENEEDEAFPSAPDTYVTSFVWLDHDVAVCHVGIRKSVLFHKGQTYLAYGLSEVVTRPRYQKQGLAMKTIKIAAQFIMDRRPDISVFTCEKNRVPFYAKGGWEAAKGVCFVGGTREKPYRSDSLGLVTMARLISSRAALCRADFENTDILFELGENQLC